MEAMTIADTMAWLEHFGFSKTRLHQTLLYELKGPAGQGWIKMTGTLDRYYLVECDVWFKKDFTYVYRIREHFIELSTVSDSRLCYEQSSGKITEIVKGIAIHINTGEPGVIRIPAGTRLTYTSFVIRENMVARNLPCQGSDTDLICPCNIALINRMPPCHHQARILSDLSHCRMPEHVKSLYCETKALEILCLLSESLYWHRREQPVTTIQDRTAVEKVRRILARRMSDPPATGELARQVGINATKLKQVFKQETGLTIFGYLKTIRLGAAVSMMADADATITSVARDIGYKSPSKFTAAFREQYDVNPGQYLRMVRQRR